MKINKKTQIYLKYVLVVLVILILGIVYYSNSITDKEKRSQDSYDTFIDNQIESEENTETQENLPTICVYICGQVCEPGVKTCAEGVRLYQLIEMAGGTTENADLNQLNLADVLTDGQKIYVPEIGETVAEGLSDSAESSKININEADESQLMTLPGIGKTRAADIIAFRSKQGRFKSVEDIMKVPGIKEAAYSKIKELICV